ncbi:MAG: signal recognition particle-docking protein FtsY [Bifidobacteriaceae bacterium]|jgi:fused signal recognition particle receptor|nr:signal recognition particle-docking protein FtsY [Bifidobacteriaceae bacterium]
MGSGSGIWLIVLGLVVAAAVLGLIVYGLAGRARRSGRGQPPRSAPAAGTAGGAGGVEADQAAGAAGPTAAAQTAGGERAEARQANGAGGLEPGGETEGVVAASGGEIEVPEAPASRLRRLRGRLAGSKSALGRALLAVLSRDQLTREDWDEFEETLLMADVGAAASEQILERVRAAMRVEGAGADPAATLRRELLAALETKASRTIADRGGQGAPGVILVVGVNGSGKTTTIGRLARLEVAAGNSVLLGAADTFRAAAADQLAAWGERVGVPVARGPEGSDPAAVAFDAVAAGIDRQIDTVIIDTAGRLHNKANLMAELEKIRRVAAKQAPITETLLVLDATTGQNGLTQARVFTEAVEVTGIVLTKLDGTAKGGIVIAVQRELGLPVKLVGLGEGPDDLAPFDEELFVDGLLGAKP